MSGDGARSSDGVEPPRASLGTQLARRMELQLEDGTRLSGDGFGGTGAVAGEVVFCTAMSGYVEALTDPSYRGQILVLTYPLVGSYGVPSPRDRGSIDGPYEADRIQVQGLVVQRPIYMHSHHAAERSLAEWLAADAVPGIGGIDTRALTIHLRERGTMRGRLVPASDPDMSVTAIDMSTVGRLVAPAEVARPLRRLRA